MVLVILLIVAGLGFMMYKRFKNRLKKQRAKVESCDVARTDWIKSKMIKDDWSQAQGEAAQKCKVPDNLQARIT